MDANELTQRYAKGEINFSGLELKGINLFGADLVSINLTQTDLRSANLIFAYLNRAQLHKANLSSTKLSGANLTQADLREIKLNDANFKQEVLDSDLPCLVDFWAQWCGPCHMVAPIVEEIAEEYKDRIKVGKLNVDEASRVASQYEIMSIPTLALFKKGRIVDKVIGVAPKAEIEKIINPHIEKEK